MALEHLDKDREFLTRGGVFTNDVIDAYIGLKMQEVTRFRMSTHPVRDGAVLQLLSAGDDTAGIPAHARYARPVPWQAWRRDGERGAGNGVHGTPLPAFVRGAPRGYAGSRCAHYCLP